MTNKFQALDKHLNIVTSVDTFLMKLILNKIKLVNNIKKDKRRNN